MAGKLTSVSVKGARHPGGHTRTVRVADGDGLFLQVTPTGAKSWLYRFQLEGRAREMGLGSLDDIGLALARQARDSARLQHKSGTDPIEARSTAKRAAAAGRVLAQQNTFRKLAEEMIASREAAWRNPKHRQQWRNTLITYAYPVIGDMPVAEIGTDAVLSVLKPIWTKKPETASRLRGRIERVLAYSKARGLRSGDNPAAWRGHLSESLPPPRSIKGALPGHFAALPWAEMSRFMQSLRRQSCVASLALQFTILNTARTNEVLGACWREIDLAECVWTCPASRMKSQREHRIPLAPGSIAILEMLKPLGSKPADPVFPGKQTTKGLSNMALLMLLRRINPLEEDGTSYRWRDGRTGEAITTHGFRSTFRDWTAEATSWSTDLAESALAHVIRDKTVAAYARGDLFAKRRLLMAEWDSFVHGNDKAAAAA